MAIFGGTICSITVNNLTALNPKTVKITGFYLDLTAKFSAVSGLLVLGIDGFRVPTSFHYFNANMADPEA